MVEDMMRDGKGAAAMDGPHTSGYRVNILPMIAPAACFLYEGVMVATLFVPGASIDGWMAAISNDLVAKVVLSVACVAACVVLLWRISHPRVVVLAECVVYLVAAAFHSAQFFMIPLLVSIYALARHAPICRSVPSAAVAALAMSAGAAVNVPMDGWSEALGGFLSAAAVFAIGKAVRAWRSSLVAAERERVEHVRAELLAAQRDHAVSQSRIAAELHDSVGHGLTTIIALSEGLVGATGDKNIDEALAGIDTVARESLAQTREAVDALASRSEDPGWGDAGNDIDTPFESLHVWDDIVPVLGRIRDIGIVVVFTETGRRADDAVQADLCFAITREALTNVARHGVEVSQIVVSWDHRADGSVAVAIRDDGSVLDVGFPLSIGTGLARLAARVQTVGGVFSFGPGADGGWKVEADLSAGKEVGRDGRSDDCR